jgi:hypothetical protein
VTSYSCNGSSCISNPISETQTCTRTAPGPQPCPATQYGAWGACDGSNACGVGGTQSRTVTSYAYDCGSGSCNPTTITETQACSGTSYPGYVTCGGVCTDTSMDSNNCGSCGRVCPYKWSSCEEGRCCDPERGCI